MAETRKRTPPPGWDDPDPEYRFYLKQGGQPFTWHDPIDVVSAGDGVDIARFSPRWKFNPEEDDVPCQTEVVIENSPEGPRCVELRLIAKPGQALTAALLRQVPVAGLVRYIASHQIPYCRHPDGKGWSVRGGEASLEDQLTYRTHARKQMAAKRRWGISEEDLQKVASVYRTAIASGQPPTATVQDQLGLRSRPQAARWVRRAREEGYLGPAPGPRKAGEVASNA